MAEIVIPSTSSNGGFRFICAPGDEHIIVGANGCGKTRLAVHLENTLQGDAHRIAAHRALTLVDDIQKTSEDLALQGLRFGTAQPNASVGWNTRSVHRYGRGKEAVALLNDYQFLLQALFAERANSVMNARQRAIDGECSADGVLAPTKLDSVKKLWELVLPHRKLKIDNDKINVIAPDGSEYQASQMSDGERAILYNIGQVVLANPNQILIIDEPELHVHRSIMSSLWDTLISHRKDCGFIFITHDLDFASTRTGTLYSIRSYSPAAGWDIEAVESTDGLSDETATLIRGSRKPILFIEGVGETLDGLLYRSVYSEWTIVAAGGADSVIKSVNAMRKNPTIAWVTCAGIVDLDDRNEDEARYLGERGIYTISVAEIENIFLMQEVFTAILKEDGYANHDMAAKYEELKDKCIGELITHKVAHHAAIRYAQRRLDRDLKRVDLAESGSIEAASLELESSLKNLDLERHYTERRESIEKAIEARDLEKIARIVDHKGLFPMVAMVARGNKPADFRNWVARRLHSNVGGVIGTAVKAALPRIEAS